MEENSLCEGSKSYHADAHIYEQFCAAEDKPGKVQAFLMELLKGKSVLDIGCGSGKYMALLAPSAARYVGLDISQEQIALAAGKSQGMGNVELICCSAEKIPLPDHSIDIVISTWGVSTILEPERRSRVLAEARRVLAPGGNIYLVENDYAGEFEYIRGRWPDASMTADYNNWLVQAGFTPVAHIATIFEFSSAPKAKHVFGAIWGAKAAERVQRKKITHNIVIFKSTS